MEYELHYLHDLEKSTPNENDIVFLHTEFDEDHEDYVESLHRLTIFNSDFSEVAIEYLNINFKNNTDEKDFFTDFETFIEELLKIDVFNPNFHTINEYYDVIRNYMDLMKYCYGGLDHIDFFNFTISLIANSLQDSHEINDWLGSNNGYNNASEMNMAGAFEIIHDALIETCNITKNSPDDLKHIYRQVASPTFSVIKNIRINNHDFKHLEQAQDYANHLVFDNPLQFFLSSLPYNRHKWEYDLIALDTYRYRGEDLTVEFTITDDIEAFELTLVSEGEVTNIATGSVYQVLVYDILDSFDCYTDLSEYESSGDSSVMNPSFDFSPYNEKFMNTNHHYQEYYSDAFFDLKDRFSRYKESTYYDTNVDKAYDLLISEYAKEVINIYAIQKNYRYLKTLDRF
ncbi:MAG: hypothetical protein ISR69_13060 [Gammaproteobacteria bacterium]|nr:hypothetical protein [Gammaproteobacteria bacterium]